MSMQVTEAYRARGHENLEFLKLVTFSFLFPESPVSDFPQPIKLCSRIILVTLPTIR